MQTLGRSSQPSSIETFWVAVRATTVMEFNKAMDDLMHLNSRAYNCFRKIPPNQWLKHVFDHEVKVEHTTNSMTKSWNGWINEIRKLPIMGMLESLRRMVMQRLHDRHEESRNGVHHCFQLLTRT